jgi:hypothetical protein
MELINTYTNIGQADIDNIEECTDLQRRGLHQVTLSNIEPGDVPQIQVGSIAEVSGALYEAKENESIAGSAVNDVFNYIKLIPGTGIATPTWTQTVPTWSEAKQGWYGINANASHRYLNFKIWKHLATYYKYTFINNSNMFRFSNPSDIDIYSNLDITGDMDIVLGDMTMSGGDINIIEGGLNNYKATVIQPGIVSAARSSVGITYSSAALIKKPTMIDIQWTETVGSTSIGICTLQFSSNGSTAWVDILATAVKDVSSICAANPGYYRVAMEMTADGGGIIAYLSLRGVYGDVTVSGNTNVYEVI